MGRIKKLFGSRFVAGSYSAFAIAVVLAILIFANLMVNTLPTHVTQIDLTENELYSISEDTKRILSGISEDVTLYLLTTTGGEDGAITRLLDQYASLSGHIKKVVVDPNERPTFLNDYDLNGNRVYQNSVLVQCGERYTLVGYDEIYVTSYSMDQDGYNYTTSTEFDGEGAITNAIFFVTSENLPKVYVLKGHGEQELPESFSGQLKKENVQVEELSLLTQEAIPEDATALILHAPESDISEQEATLLKEYLSGNGNLILITNYIKAGEMKNLLSVTQQMGLTIGDGMIIEGDANKHVGRYPHYLLPDIASSEVSTPLVEQGYYVLLPVAEPITTLEGTSATVTELLTTSDQSFSKAAGLEAVSTEKEEGDTDGPFTVGALSQNGGKLLWIASAPFLNESVDMMVGGANSSLVFNTISWMGGHEDRIYIRGKSMDEARLTLTATQSAFWSGIMIGVIPAVLLFLGIMIRVRRARR